MLTTSKFGLLARTFTAIVGAILCLGQVPSFAADQGVVGLSDKGGNASEYIGVIQQVGPAFTAVGYLTHVQGVNPADLFTDPVVRNAATARLTFTSNATAVSNSNVGSVTQIGAVGTLKIYFNALGGADFSNAASFAAGDEVASFDARFQNILAVIAPNTGVASATVDATQTAAQSFTLNGQPLRFGHPRLVQHMSLSGKGTRTQVDPPVSTTEFAASAVTD